MNEFKATGNLVRDPEVRHLASGSKVAIVRMAVDNRKKNKDTGEWENGPGIYIDLEAWNNVADSLEEMKKGQKVEIDGFVKMDEWQTQDGQKRNKLVFVLRSIVEKVFDNKEKEDNGSNNKPSKKSVSPKNSARKPQVTVPPEPEKEEDIPF